MTGFISPKMNQAKLAGCYLSLFCKSAAMMAQYRPKQGLIGEILQVYR